MYSRIWYATRFIMRINCTGNQDWADVYIAWKIKQYFIKTNFISSVPWDIL